MTFAVFNFSTFQDFMEFRRRIEEEENSNERQPVSYHINKQKTKNI